MAYLVKADAWVRSSDLNTGSTPSGIFTFIEEGIVYGNSGWVLTTDGATIGTSDISFTQFTGAGNVSGGNNITVNGSEVNLNTTLNGLSSITSDTLTMNGKINLNAENNTTNNGIYYWNTINKAWGTYMSESGSGKSFNGGDACEYGGISSHAIRFRAANTSNKGFIWENDNSTDLMLVLWH